MQSSKHLTGNGHAVYQLGSLFVLSDLMMKSESFVVNILLVWFMVYKEVAVA
jgi:hypothetical protein